MKVLVCGSVDKNLKKEYLEGIDKIAQNLVENGDGTLSVGATTGSIGAMYNNMKKLDGHIDLIVPAPYADDAKGMTANSILIVDTLFMLQQVALRNSDVTIILPGGNGTLAELYMITDSIKSKFDTDLVIIYNINGYYNKLKEMNDFMLEAGSLQKDQYQFFNWCDTAEEVIALLNNIRAKKSNKKCKK